MSRKRCVGFMADLEGRDLDRLLSWFTEESRLWVPPTKEISGLRRIRALFRTIYRMYTDIHWTVTEVYPVEGAHPDGGPGTYIYLSDSVGTIGQNTPYTNHLITVMKFDANDKIVSLSDYFKDTAIFQTGRTHAGTE